MTKDELLAALRAITAKNHGTIETDHQEADDLLLDYINDPEIRAAYGAIDKRWA